jgi:glucokinase
MMPPMNTSVSSTSCPGWPRLVADVGGTNARLAWLAAPGAALSHLRQLATADYAGFADAVRAYLRLEGLDGQQTPRQLGMGIANPVTGDRVQMTNCPWQFSQRELAAELGLERLVVVNDFTALALALPVLGEGERRRLGGSAEAVIAAPMALLGAGTGLGVSGLIPAGPGRWVPLSGEGGHVTLAATDAREAAILERLRQRFGHVSAERVLSGSGLVHLYTALAELDGAAVSELTPAELTRRGLTEPGSAESDPRARETLGRFCAWLGHVAGDLALTLGARGGVWIGGGITPRLGQFLDRSSFRARFEAKGRFQTYLAPIPVWLITAETSPALLGAAQALAQS